MPLPLRVLLVEDSEDDAELLVRELSRAGFDVLSERVQTRAELQAALARQRWDIVLSDYTMPGLNGLEALAVVRARNADLPFIIVSGTIGEDVAVEVMRAGAQDYILKDRLARLSLAVERELKESATRRGRQEIERLLSESEDRVKTLLEISPDAIFVQSAERFLFVNSAALRLLGAGSPDQLVGRHAIDFVHPDHHAQVYDRSRRLREKEAGPMRSEERLVRLDGCFVDVEVVAAPFEYAGAPGALLLARDITARKRTEAELRNGRVQLEYEVAASMQSLAVTRRRLRQQIEQRARAEEQIQRLRTGAAGLRYGEWLWQPAKVIAVTLTLLAAYEWLQILLAPRVSPSWSYPITIVAGTVVAAVIVLALIRSRNLLLKRLFDETLERRKAEDALQLANDRLEEAVKERTEELHRSNESYRRELTQRRRAEERLTAMAHYDHLTGLPNRALLLDRLQHAVSIGLRRGGSVGVALIDIDDFKTVNDSFGHEAGDRLLKEISERMSRAFRPGDTVGRLGGDEFVAVIPNIASAQELGMLGERIRELLARPVDVGGGQIAVTASIGFSVYPEDGTDAETLLKRADVAMYRAKAGGQGMVQLYSPSMNARARAQLELESALRAALEQDEYKVVYQPMVELATGRLRRLHVQVCWQRADGDIVPAPLIAPMLEDSGLAVPVGEWMLAQACRQVQAWRSEGCGEIPVVIPLSRRQWKARDVVYAFDEALQEYGVKDLLEIEIAESSVVEDTGRAAEVMNDIRSLGVQLLVGGFGAGHASLNVLRNLPLHGLKIDRSIVDRIGEDDKDAALIHATVTMARRTGLEAIADGVETQAQRDRLLRLGCDQGQGILFGRPMSVDQATEYLRNNGLGPV
ncbi:MAG TPA: EAL domain-containing protein [Burkholderiales bacterium]|nr:EAL domain-containing protein [Burkholderiales bacterium]